jgi:hypothetical protein
VGVTVAVGGSVAAAVLTVPRQAPGTLELGANVGFAERRTAL